MEFNSSRCWCAGDAATEGGETPDPRRTPMGPSEPIRVRANAGEISGGSWGNASHSGGLVRVEEAGHLTRTHVPSRRWGGVRRAEGYGGSIRDLSRRSTTG